MSSGSAKQIKKQAMAQVSEEMNLRLDKIEAFCQDSLQKQDKRAKAIQSWIIQEVSVKIQNDLFNADCTIDAVVEVLAANGLQVEDFKAKVDAQKIKVAERKKSEAEASMRAQLEAQEAAAKENQAPAEAPVQA